MSAITVTIVEGETHTVTVPSLETISIQTAPETVQVVTVTSVGPRGPAGSADWETVTQSEYDAMDTPRDPGVVYLIV